MWRHWLSLLIGIWIFISPWVLDLTNRAAIVWNSVIVGIVVFILSLVDLSRGERGSP
ncbi:MAG: SPW repeat protein [Alicyclobacillaceae bacterium]|nr:SPW repeat protein [Alicyclobacillaceae bacterium]